MGEKEICLVVCDVRKVVGLPSCLLYSSMLLMVLG